MLQFKNMISSKSVLLFLIFLTTTAYGFLQNDNQATSRRINIREKRMSTDRRQQVGRNMFLQNVGRQIDEKDRVYENLYDRRSFRTGTTDRSKVDERRMSRDSNNNRRQVRNSFEEWRDNRVSVNNRQRFSVDQNRNTENLRNRNNNNRYMDRKVVRDQNTEYRRQIPVNRFNNQTPSLREYRAYMSRSDSTRQVQRNAQPISRRYTEGRRNVVTQSDQALFSSRYDHVRSRTDSTRHLRENRRNFERRNNVDSRNMISQDSRVKNEFSRSDATRRFSDNERRINNFITRSTESRQAQNYRKEMVRESTSNNIQRDWATFRYARKQSRLNSRNGNNFEKTSSRVSRQDKAETRQTERKLSVRTNSPILDTTSNRARSYVIPQRRISNAVRYLPTEDFPTVPSENRKKSDSLLAPQDTYASIKQKLSSSSWVNAVQIILVVYLIGQIFANSSLKNKPRFYNMLSTVSVSKAKVY